MGLFHDPDELTVEIECLHEDIIIPEYKTDGAACADVYAHTDDDIVIESQCVEKIPTGFRLNIPDEYEVLLRPRSGLSMKGISLSNCVGTIDSDFTSEVMVLLMNHSKTPFIVKNGSRVAQMCLKRVEKLNFKQVTTLSRSTVRGGFGSTGE